MEGMSTIEKQKTPRRIKADLKKRVAEMLGTIPTVRRWDLDITAGTGLRPFVNKTTGPIPVPELDGSYTITIKINGGAK